MNDPYPPNPPNPAYPPQQYPPYGAPPPAYPPGTILPMTIGQILDRISRLVRSRWKTLAAIGVVPFAAVIVIEVLVFGVAFLAGGFSFPPNPASFQRIAWFAVPAYLLLIPIFFVIYGLYYGASSYAALQVDHEQPVTFTGAYAHAWTRVGPYVWLMVLRSLIVAGPFIPIVLIFAVSPLMVVTGHVPDNPGLLFLLVPLAVLLYLGAFAWAIYMALRLSLAFCACVHEGITARQAITRSGVLTKGAKGRIFLVVLVIYAISYAVMMVFYVLGMIVVFAFLISGAVDLKDMTLLGYVAVGLVGLFFLALLVLWSALLMAAYSTAFAVIYRDQCVRLAGPPVYPETNPGQLPAGAL